MPLERLGGSERLLGRLAALPGVPARVVRVDRDRVAVTDGTHVTRTDPERSFIADPDTGSTGLPAVGDWVTLTDAAVGDRPPGITALGPRYGRLLRRDPGEPQPQLLACGVDVVVVTVALDRPRNIARIEREVVTAAAAAQEVVVALTKADMAADPATEATELGAALPNTAVIPLTAVDPDDGGVRRLVEMIRRAGTGVLLGASGAGKSTLANAVVRTQVAEVGTVRAGDRRGRHTTAARRLVAVPGGGALIDMPGLRALGLWDAHGGLDRAFPEITGRASACRFADCTHGDEPDCAVRDAVARGAVEEGRLRRYRALVDEMTETAAAWEQTARRRRRRTDRGDR